METICQLSQTTRYLISAVLVMWIIVAPFFLVYQSRKDRPITRGAYTMYGRKQRSLNRFEKVLARLRII